MCPCAQITATERFSKMFVRGRSCMYTVCLFVSVNHKVDLIFRSGDIGGTVSLLFVQRTIIYIVKVRSCRPEQDLIKSGWD